MYYNDSPEFIPHRLDSPLTAFSTDPPSSISATAELSYSAYTPMSMDPSPRIGGEQLLQAVQICRNNYANLAQENQYLRAQCQQQNIELHALQHAYHSLRIRYATLNSESPSSELAPVEGMDEIGLQFDKSHDNALSGGKLAVLHTFVHPSHSSYPSKVVFSPCGEFLACAVQNSVEVRRCMTGEVVANYSSADAPPDSSGMNACRFSHDGKILIAGGTTGIDIWNTNSSAIGTIGTSPRVKHHIPISGCSEIHSIDISKNNPAIFASGSDDKIVHLWNTKNAKLMKSLGDHREENKAINALRFGDASSPHLATAADDEMARIWDVTSGHLLHTLKGHTGKVLDLDYSGDNRALVTGGTDTCVKVWDLRNAKAALTFKQHSGIVRGVAYAPNHRWVISGAEDSTVVFWDLRLGRAAMQFRPHSDAVVDVAHNPNKPQFASTSKDRTTRLWSYGPAAN